MIRERPSTLAEYEQRIRRIVADQRGDALVEWAFGEVFVRRKIRELHEQSSHSGYAADMVRRYIATQYNDDIARKHEAGVPVNPVAAEVVS